MANLTPAAGAVLTYRGPFQKGTTVEPVLQLDTIWYLYVLRRLDTPKAGQVGRGNRTLYVGITNDPVRRLGEHNKGEVRPTRGRRWELVALVMFDSQAKAAAIERWMKTGDSRDKRMFLINLYDRLKRPELMTSPVVARYKLARQRAALMRETSGPEGA